VGAKERGPPRRWTPSRFCCRTGQLIDFAKRGRRHTEETLIVVAGLLSHTREMELSFWCGLPPFTCLLSVKIAPPRLAAPLPSIPAGSLTHPTSLDFIRTLPGRVYFSPMLFLLAPNPSQFRLRCSHKSLHHLSLLLTNKSNARLGNGGGRTET